MRWTLICATILTSLFLLAGCQSSSVAPDPKIPDPPDPPEVLDTTAPTSTILPLEQEQLSLQFELAFTAEDDDSGVAGVEILVRTPDLVWSSLGVFAESPVTYLATEPGPHSFVGVAVDSAGNLQAIPEVAQAETLVPEPIIIVDQTGEEFDITNAVLRYYLTASAWGHGIGRNTIRPINNPTWILPGEPAYPHEYSTADIVALTGEDDGQFQAHAYGVLDFANREVVNDYIGGAHLSVTY